MNLNDQTFRTVPFYTFLDAFIAAGAINAHITESCATWDEIIAKEALLSAQERTSTFCLSQDGRSGFIARASGELCAVFSTVRGRGDALVKHAIYMGATHLDHFEGYLSHLYERNGFILVGSERNHNGDNHPRVEYRALSEA